MFTPSGALGQCRAESVAMDVLLEQEQVAMVFVGMVDRVDREGSADAVTFRAERVWKGPVTQRTTIYAPVSAHTAKPEPVRRCSSAAGDTSSSPIV